MICEGRSERPQDGKVANDGTFILNDWMLGEGLKGRFVAFRRDGTAILARDIAANLMTNAALDPFGKIPEFKYCAVAIRRGGNASATQGYGEGIAR